jgi:cytochrome c oxidase assembly factor CtaG
MPGNTLTIVETFYRATRSCGRLPRPGGTLRICVVVQPDLPVALALAIAGLLYLRAVRLLRGRRYRVGIGQQLAWWIGLALFAAGLMSPIDRLAEDLLSAHMAQHLLIAELGAPLLLAGARSPVLLFMLPKPALVSLVRRRWLRSALSFLSRPLVAIPLYLVVLYTWHFAFAFEGALRSEPIHLLQHQSFVAISLLVWWSALEPSRRRLRGELWKVGYIFGARMGGMMLGMAFIAMRSPAYAGFYGERAREHGLAPLADQQLAGGMMLSLDFLLVVFALAFFFWRASEDDLRAQRAAAEAPGRDRARKREEPLPIP